MIIIIDLKPMIRENSGQTQHPYLYPFSLPTLPTHTFNQPFYSTEAQNYYKFAFFPALYGSTSYSLQTSNSDIPQPSEKQPSPISTPPEAADPSKTLEKGENSFKKLGKSVTVEASIFCNCSKSGCLKQYCRCYRMGKVCSDACNCMECRNCEKQLFAGRKKRGRKSKCNCKKTRCSSKYCDCLASGGRCGEDCTCVNCENQ